MSNGNDVYLNMTLEEMGSWSRSWHQASRSSWIHQLWYQQAISCHTWQVTIVHETLDSFASHRKNCAGFNMFYFSLLIQYIFTY